LVSHALYLACESVCIFCWEMQPVKIAAWKITQKIHILLLNLKISALPNKPTWISYNNLKIMKKHILLLNLKISALPYKSKWKRYINPKIKTPKISVFTNLNSLFIIRQSTSKSDGWTVKQRVHSVRISITHNKYSIVFQELKQDLKKKTKNNLISTLFCIPRMP
jgi:uncharacterized protein YheU (UPF0270 family)